MERREHHGGHERPGKPREPDPPKPETQAPPPAPPERPAPDEPPPHKPPPEEPPPLAPAPDDAESAIFGEEPEDPEGLSPPGGAPDQDSEE